jgi:two-component system, LytTR family, response regulator
LIVDDEPIARRVLREELELFPEVRVVGEAADGREALQKIADLAPDLVFLDLQMPVMGGFEVVRNLTGSRLPAIVIVTAFDQYAIQAFDAGAVDYLLKPITEARLREAIKKVSRRQDEPAQIAQMLATPAAAPAVPNSSRCRKIVGRSGDDYFLLDADEVLAFQAEGALVWIMTSKHRLLATESLRLLESKLGGPQFQRVHRNAIVNVSHIRKMSALSSQRWRLTLSNQQELLVSKRQARHIRAILHW